MNKFKVQCQKATFKVFKAEDNAGQGVLIPGGYILTAAHCVRFELDGSMATDHHSLIKVESAGGQRFTLSPLSIEPVSDIAVLGPPDGQVFPEEYISFIRYSSTLSPIPICSGDWPENEEKPVYIFTHHAKWITAKAWHSAGDERRLILSGSSKKRIEGGTSGSPILCDTGELVAIVSNSGSQGSANSEENIWHGTAPRPLLALPMWIVRRIETATNTCLTTDRRLHRSPEMLRPCSLKRAGS
jgi:hypothetical protein